MSDRIVRKISPRLASDPSDRLWKYSDFAHEPNIVLLGDPGAGKSHLLREAAKTANGRLLTTRTFLNDPDIPIASILFIDALDEKRAGRRDRGTIDAIVQKLFRIKPAQVRIACREHDWLGGTDLAVFRAYFDQHGGVVVLGLQPLTEAEQHAVLRANGIAEPAAFTAEAMGRGLQDLLVNPQNLTMLVEAVREGDWPSTRSELFETTSRILLREHNKDHARSGAGIYSADEIRLPTGAACALRLISDVAGISLADTEEDSQFPSYRTIPFFGNDQVLAALGRRTFVSAGPEVVDYAHRTRAEYLGAGWLAEQVRQGLPIGRVRAILGVDGIPTPELRGLHAWLAIRLPEYADALIDADPYGILAYADASSLAVSQRKKLVEALGRFFAEDPLYRDDASSLPAIGALSTPDMVDHFRTVLRSSGAPFGLKSLILEAMAVGTPLPQLYRDAISLLSEKLVPYGLKHPALRAVIRMGPTALAAVTQLYSTLRNSADEIRLRSDILSRTYNGYFKPTDVARLAVDGLTCAEDIVGGIFWPLVKAVPASDIPAVLDTIVVELRQVTNNKKSDNESDVRHLVEGLIERVVRERSGDVSGADVWRWLSIRRLISDGYGYRDTKDVKDALCDQEKLVRALFDSAIDDLGENANLWEFTTRLSEVLPVSLHTTALGWLIKRILEEKDEPKKREFLYGVALSWNVSNPTVDVPPFEILYALGDAEPELAKIRQPLLTLPCDGWRLKDAERRATYRNEQEDAHNKTLQAFEKDQVTIKTGDDANWLRWIGQVYFAQFTDVDRSATPRQRLQTVLGESNVHIAIDALKAGLRRSDVPSVADVADAVVKNSYPTRWYALMAGMDEAWSENPEITAYESDLIDAQIALDLVMPTMSKRGNTEYQDEHSWKRALLNADAARFRNVYLEVAQHGFRHGREHIDGVYQLLSHEALIPFRAEVSISLLRDFPNAQPRYLQDLLAAALDDSSRQAELVAVARELLQSNLLGVEQMRLWVTAAYLVAPEEFRGQFEAEAAGVSEVVWILRALTAHGRHNNKGARSLRVSQLELMASIVARHFKATEFPTGGWSGDENAWEATAFARALISELSADRTVQATEALRRLERSAVLSGYADTIKHALVNQRALVRQADYEQPNWEKAIASLSNREPANIADLQALLHTLLADLATDIRGRNNDIYKQFWNENRHGKVSTPKSEESCRDVLLGMLRDRLRPLGILVEPEGRMVGGKRVDISVALVGRKSVIELKRDVHRDLWTAHIDQLERFYAIDRDASGYGIYGVFWFGGEWTRKIRRRPDGGISPRSSRELSDALNSMIASAERSRLQAFVIDVSPPDSTKVKGRRIRPSAKNPAARRKRPKPKTSPKSVGTRSVRAARPRVKPKPRRRR